MPDTVNQIGECAFKNCEVLSKITIPSGITKLSKEIFCGCKSLATIDIPDSVTEIEEMAFKDCELLDDLVIPKKITNLGFGLFAGCKNLESVTIPAKFLSVDLMQVKSCEKTSFDVELTEIGAQKIQVIKVVRQLTGFGLKEAKDLVEDAPKMVKEDVSKEEANKAKADLEAVGAKITIK